MRTRLSARGAVSVLTGRDRIATLERSYERMAAKIAELEQRLAQNETRFEMSVRFFEHRVDQIYARILPVLSRERGLFAGPDEPLASSAPGAPGMASAIDLHARRATGFLAPGRCGTPFADHGFRLALGLAVERRGAVELVGAAEGAAIFGPYRRMTPGAYRIRWHLEAVPGAAGPVRLGFDVYSPNVDRLIGRTALEGSLEGAQAIELAVEIGVELGGAVFELRLHQQGGAAARLTAIEIERA